MPVASDLEVVRRRPKAFGFRVLGAPSSDLLGTAATQADSALEKYGFLPTLTLRLGFDLI